MKAYPIITLLLCLTLKSWGQIDSTSTRDTVYSIPSKSTNLALVTGYHIQKNHFAEVGIAIRKDGLGGSRHPRTLVYGISNELKLNDNFFGD